MNYKKNRIQYLLKEYSDTHANSGEVFITNSPSKKFINTNNTRTRLKQEINEVISEVSQRDIIYDNVEFICMHNKFNKLCGNCSRKKVIAVICLVVLREYNPKLKEEENRLWEKYNLSWKLYGRIVANLLKNIRENGMVF